ncbi:MAG: TetR family transcriptional regulator [Treponema sp.]|nr:TetR family transcriptional regulator [Treponema sp.]
MAEYIRARTENQKEERMSEIKQAADMLFKTLPYTDITLTVLAEKLGWSRANLYKYATTKEEIYLEIEQDRMKEYFSSLLTVFPEGCRFSEGTVADMWAAQVNSHQDYFRYSAFLLTIIERNVTVERLIQFKKTFYDFQDELKKRIAFALDISEKDADTLNMRIINFGTTYLASCTTNPLVQEALKKMERTLPPKDLPGDMRDFILMNISWIRGHMRSGAEG